MGNKKTHRPIWTDANHPPFLHALLEDIDPTLLMRKGTLHLLCNTDIKEAVAKTVYQTYYSDTSFDTLPSLHRALSKACLEHESVHETILAAVVIRDMDIFALLADDIVAWLDRFDEIRQLSRATKKFPLTIAHEETEIHEIELRAICYPLGIGDTLLLTTREAVDEMGSRKLRRLLRGGRSPKSLIRALGRHTGATAVIDVPGFSPVPAIESMPAHSSPAPKRTSPHEQKEGISPIWPALLIAILSVTLVFGLKRPTISREELFDIFDLALPPVANPTISPTPGGGMTPTPATAASPPTTATEHPTIELLHPSQNESAQDRELIFTWTWDGELEENEYFDLRLWRLGEPEESVAWTKEREHTERLSEEGWYSWKVYLVRGQEGVIDQVLTETMAVNFEWHPGDDEDAVAE